MDNLIYVMMSRGYGWNLVRSLFAWLDTAVYTVFGWAMQLIFDIAEISSNEALQNFYDDIHTRIYGILAIFMLFKITISLLNYLVNPDAIGDKERGIGKLAMRTILSLSMLLAFPAVFDFILIDVQPHLLEALPRVVLGVESIDNESTGSDMQLAGDKISFSIYNGVWFNKNCADINHNNYQGQQSNGCFMHTPEVGKTFMSLIPEHINDPEEGDSSTYRYEYYPVVGLVVGIVMTLIIVGICIDVAIRLFKLIILETIAPIPILSYIDPKSSKDGAFSKWIKMVISVYLDLFIKLAVVYFMILVINELIVKGVVQSITASSFATNGTLRGGLVLVALVVGLLFFAKDAPKFISDALGIKTGENGKLFGGLGKLMAAGAIGAGAIGSAVAAGRANYMSDEAREKGHNPLRFAKNVGAGLLGGLTGIGAGAMAAVNAKDHNAKAALDAMTKHNSIALARGAAGSTMLGRGIARGQNLILGETSYDRMNKEKANLEAANKNTVAYKNTMEKKALEKDNLFIDWNGHQLNWLDYMANLDGARNGNEASLQWMINHGFSKMATVEEEYEETYMEEYDEEYEETYTEFEEVGGEWVQVTKTRPATRKATRPATRTATRTVQKTVADWQSAQVQQDKIKDTVAQAHAANFMSAVEAYEKDGDRTVFEKFGTEYNDYRNAKDANDDAGFKDVDYVHYGNSSGTGVKQTLGKQNERITNIATSTKYKGAKANADATKK